MDVQGKLGDARDFLEGVDEANDPYDLIIARDEGDDDSADYEFGRAKTVGTLPRRLGEFVRGKVETKFKSLEDG